MQLEDSNGKTTTPTSVQDVQAVISRLGSDIEHCILSDGERYIQTAGNQIGLVVEYQDESGHYEANGTQTVETVKQVFSAYLQRDASWKSLLSFTCVDNTMSSSTTGNTGQVSGSHQTQQRGLKDTLLDTIKREVKHKANSVFGRGIRDILRKFK